MFCTNCGKQVDEGSTFCPYCGEKLTEDTEPASVQPQNTAKPEIVQTASQPANNPTTTNIYYQQPALQIPPEYTPISMWGYFGYEILFSIPIIGFIILIVMCFAPSNKNVKNFARSYFCLFIIALILIAVIGAATGFSLFHVFDNLNSLL